MPDAKTCLLDYRWVLPPDALLEFASDTLMTLQDALGRSSAQARVLFVSPGCETDLRLDGTVHNEAKWGIHLTQVAPRRCGLVDPWTPAHCTQNAPWGARRRSAGNWATRLRFGPIKDYARAMAIAGLETWCYRQAFPGAANGQPQYVVVT